MCLHWETRVKQNDNSHGYEAIVTVLYDLIRDQSPVGNIPPRDLLSDRIGHRANAGAIFCINHVLNVYVNQRSTRWQGLWVHQEPDGRVTALQVWHTKSSFYLHQHVNHRLDLNLAQTSKLSCPSLWCVCGSVFYKTHQEQVIFTASAVYCL